jgi:hypothetical protein
VAVEQPKVKTQVGTRRLVQRDDFKVVSIFIKVEFVRYMSNMCTVRLRLDLSCNRGLGRVLVKLYF